MILELHAFSYKKVSFNLYKYSRIEPISNLVPTVLVSVKHEMNSINSELILALLLTLPYSQWHFLLMLFLQ